MVPLSGIEVVQGLLVVFPVYVEIAVDADHFVNVLITGHQAFFTDNALSQIAATTLANLDELAQAGSCGNVVPLPAS